MALADFIRTFDMIICEAVNDLKVDTDDLLRKYGAENFNKILSLNEKIVYTYFNDIKTLPDLKTYYKPAR